jgi:hypothetical protein
MRTRVVSSIVLLSLPVVMSAQVRRPRVGRNPTPTAAPLPPTNGKIAQTLEYQRSKWSAQGYSLISNVRLPNAAGASSATIMGTGTQGGYRLNDHFAGTVDVTTSIFGSALNSQTAEVGTRFSPGTFEQEVRGFVDVRGSYMHISDNYNVSNDQFSSTSDYATTRYARGVGGVVGAGFAYALTNSFALSTELSALRSRMTAYRSTGPAAIPNTGNYWMTQIRLTVGLNYSATHVNTLKQNPH